MSYPNTTVLQLPVPDKASTPVNSFVDRVADDQLLSSSLVAIDQFASAVTGSMSSVVFVSGNLAPFKTQVVYAEIANTPRVISQVVAFAQNSGSGGVTSVDVELSSSAAGFQTIFANAAARAKVSSSLGNYGIARSAAPVTASWNAGALMRVVLYSDTIDQASLSVNVMWKPSGSYGA
mgnify:CR=1 FL=1